MITLDTPTRSLQATVASNPAVPLGVFCSYEEVSNTGYDTVKSTVTTISSTSAVVVLGANTAGLQRVVRFMSFVNALSNSSVTLAVSMSDSAGPAISIIYAASLSPGDVVQYTKDDGFNVTDFTGAAKSAPTTGGPSGYYTSAQIDALIAQYVRITNPLKAGNTAAWQSDGSLKVAHDDGSFGNY